MTEYEDPVPDSSTPLGRIALHCAIQSAQCVMTLGIDNIPFLHLLQCMAEHGCLPELPPDGECLAGPEDTVQEITDISIVEGGWWVVRGVNCGQDEVWTGAYDWYPCQHERYLRL